MVTKDKFYEAGGFDESLIVAYNDVALCFSLLEHGYRNVLRPDVSLIHYESVSRGLDSEDEEKTRRRIAEMERLYELHPSMKGVDPCYNPNFSTVYNNYSLKDTIHYSSITSAISVTRIGTRYSIPMLSEVVEYDKPL